MPTFKLIPKEEMSAIIPLLMKLDQSIDEKILKERLPEMIDHNYLCLGIYHEGQLIGMSGFWLLNKYYVGKHLEPDNVFILEEYRSAGIGHQLVQWLENYAREKGCRALELNCYIKNEKGCKFWEREGFTRLGIHYQKRIGDK